MTAAVISTSFGVLLEINLAFLSLKMTNNIAQRVSLGQQQINHRSLLASNELMTVCSTPSASEDQSSLSPAMLARLYYLAPLAT